VLTRNSSLKINNCNNLSPSRCVSTRLPNPSGQGRLPGYEKDPRRAPVRPLHKKNCMCTQIAGHRRGSHHAHAWVEILGQQNGKAAQRRGTQRLRTYSSVLRPMVGENGTKDIEHAGRVVRAKVDVEVQPLTIPSKEQPGGAGWAQKVPGCTCERVQAAMVLSPAWCGRSLIGDAKERTARP